MIIRRYQRSDAMEAAFVVRDTFRRFNVKDGTRSAIEEYVGFYDVNKRGLENIERQFEGMDIFYVAVQKNKVVGLIRGSTKRIINLFVLGQHHGRGIGEDLVKHFERDAKRRGSSEIKIRATTYATPFYEHMGYKKTTGIRSFRIIKGLVVQPMKKELA